MLIADVDDLSGFEDALHAVFPQTEVQRCLAHQVRYSLKYAARKNRQAVAADLKAVCPSATRETAAPALLQPSERQWDRSVHNWELILNQLAVRMEADCHFEGKVIYTTVLTNSILQT